jgi:hypothetical protein
MIYCEVGCGIHALATWSAHKHMILTNLDWLKGA